MLNDAVTIDAITATDEQNRNSTEMNHAMQNAKDDMVNANRGRVFFIV